jgi:hypothetical protein
VSDTANPVSISSGSRGISRTSSSKVRAAPLIADPSRDPDIEAKVEIRAQLLALSVKAVRHRARQPGALRAQDLGEARMRVARMKKSGLPHSMPSSSCASNHFSWSGCGE